MLTEGYADEPPPITVLRDCDDFPPRDPDIAGSDLDRDDPVPGSPTAPDVNAGAKRARLWLGSAVVLVAALIGLVFLVFGGRPAPTSPPQHRAATPAAVAAVPTVADHPGPPHDQAIAYDPATESCPGGPTSPLALTDTASESAWVCSRGPQESQLDGQILHIAFLCDRSRPEATCSYMLDSLSVTPGWLPKTPGGKDEWLQHRIVTRMQFTFYNGDRLAADPFYLDTNSVHGPVPATLPGTILASRVEVMILHTERPSATPTTTAPPGPGGDSAAPLPGLLDPVAGSGDPAAPPPPIDPSLGATSDPVDATFAISQLQFFGHAPN
jgi:hypothetical protein